MPEVTLNYWAIIVSAIVSMALGAAWYSPILFGNQWMKLMGWTKEQVGKKDANKGYFIAAVGALVLAYVMSHIADYAQATTIGQGLQTGFWVWLGFAATTSVGTAVFEGKPLKLWGINTGYNLVQFLLTGAIVAVWV